MVRPDASRAIGVLSRGAGRRRRCPLS